MATSAPQANNVLTKYKGKPTTEKPRHFMLIIMAAEKARKGGRLSERQFEKVTKKPK